VDVKVDDMKALNEMLRHNILSLALL